MKRRIEGQWVFQSIKRMRDRRDASINGRFIHHPRLLRSVPTRRFKTNSITCNGKYVTVVAINFSSQFKFQLCNYFCFKQKENNVQWSIKGHFFQHSNTFNFVLNFLTLLSHKFKACKGVLKTYNLWFYRQKYVSTSQSPGVCCQSYFHCLEAWTSEYFFLHWLPVYYCLVRQQPKIAY